jgi:hypothetical protein
MAVVWRMGSERVLVVNASYKRRKSRFKQQQAQTGGQTNGTKESVRLSKIPCFRHEGKTDQPRGGLRVTQLVQQRLSLQSKLAKMGELIEF